MTKVELVAVYARITNYIQKHYLLVLPILVIDGLWILVTLVASGYSDLRS